MNTAQLDMSALTLPDFCSVQGVDDFTRFTVVRMHGTTKVASYQQWYNDLKNDFAIGEMRDYNSTKPKSKD